LNRSEVESDARVGALHRIPNNPTFTGYDWKGQNISLQVRIEAMKATNARKTLSKKLEATFRR
jgi:hypothetical protein